MINNVKKPSLIATVLWTIFFFPVGFYYIYKRCTCNKLDASNNSKRLKTFAYILMVIGFIYFFMGMSGGMTTEGETVDTSIFFMALIIFGGLGIIFMLKAIKLGKPGKRYLLYKSIIASGQEANISSIAQMVSEEPEKVEREIQELIDEGYFTGVFIDFNTKEIMSNQRQQMDQRIVINVVPPTALTEMKPKIKTIKCPNCGGNNQVIDGQTCECEFCGAPLS